MNLSERTREELVEVAWHTHRQLDLVFARLGLTGDDALAAYPKNSKAERVRRAFDLLGEEGREIELVRALIEDHTGQIEDQGERLQHLVQALNGDGYEVTDGRIVPTTPTPAPLAQEITMLEEGLSERGLDVAARHYRQAVDSYSEGRREASNGQLRSALEGALLALCAKATGKRAKDPRGAVAQLRTAGLLDGDESKMIEGLIGVSSDNGAHAGLTNDEEALFRLHFTTAALRYLLSRLGS